MKFEGRLHKAGGEEEFEISKHENKENLAVYGNNIRYLEDRGVDRGRETAIDYLYTLLCNNVHADGGRA